MKSRKIYKFNPVITVILGLLLITVGCNKPQQTQEVNSNLSTSNSSATNANVNLNTNIAQPTPKTASVKLPVTLPVLDAMFYDENFIAELKSKINLTDEEIDKLKTASDEAVKNLGENDANAGSTRAATSRAEAEIRKLLGEEKTDKLFELVSNRWSSGEMDAETLTSAKPNAVPTDTRIVVNAPAYRMDVFQDGKLTKTYKIGIGYPEFPLPKGMRKADTIIFNPTWTPPDEPWVKGKVQAGKKVAAGSKLNPLGPIKIPIGLPSLIHGGKQVARLGTFASHGCVGLTDAQVKDFSKILSSISGTTISDEDLKTYEKEKDKTKNVQLAKTIPVELRYETIVVENGKLKIFRDVYEEGTNTEENLRKVLEVYGVSFDQMNEADRRKISDALMQMNVDASGQPIKEMAANTNSSKEETNTKNSNKNNDGKVTRTIKGKKEIEIVLAELSGKGYPSPVALNSGM
jgi:lipoprotein-anchoring transpeptidase ErfK/SrfK